VARETKIGLLIGLAFIVIFSIIISEHGASKAVDYLYTDAGEGEIHEVIAPGGQRAADPFAPPGTSQKADDSTGIVAVDGRGAEGPAVTRTPGGRGDTEGIVAAKQAEAAFAQQGPPRPAQRTYAVRPGDNLIRIARKVYGARCGNLWQKIYEANRETVSAPRRLKIGQTIVIPRLDEPENALTEQTSPPSQTPPTISLTAKELAEVAGRQNGLQELFVRAKTVAERTYTVQPGDSFYGIARKLYGDVSKARLLMVKNRHLVSDPRRLRIGQKILLLDGAVSVSLQDARSVPLRLPQSVGGLANR